MYEQQTGHTFSPARVPGSRPAPRHRTRRGPILHTEALESRALFAVAAPVDLARDPVVNVTQLLENQHSPAVVVNRQDPANIYIAGTSDSRGTGPLDDVDNNDDQEPDFLPPFEDSVQDPGDRGVIDALTFDATNYSISPFVAEAVAPSLAADEFGNIFLAFYDVAGGTVNVLLSTDGGISFNPTPLATFSSPGFGLDTINTFFFATSDSPQPTVVAGAGSVWVCFEDSTQNQIVASGARVDGLGAVGEFLPTQAAFRSDTGKFADISIGPDGQVMVMYEVLKFDPDIVLDPDEVVNLIGTFGEEGAGEIFCNIDPDGLGQNSFGRRFKVTDTRVGYFDPVSSLSQGFIDASPGVVYDRSGGPFNGRAWMVYTEEGHTDSGSNTEILLRFSDDDGVTWSSPRHVVDDEFARGTQFLPRIALDQTTGNVAITWVDTRMDSSDLTFGPNEASQIFGTVGVPTVDEGGISFSENIKISDGFSVASRSRGLVEYGEYMGLDFHNNVFYPVWADNSNSTGNNPSGGVNAPTALATLDLYTTRVFVTQPNPTPPEQAPVGPGSPLTPQFIGKDTITKGKFYKFQVRFESPNGINLATLGDDDLLITGPNGYNLFADFQKAKRARGGTIATATYISPAPGGKYDQSDNGLYTILLQGGSVTDLTGTATVDGLLDQFLVSSSLPSQAPPNLPAAPVSAALQAAADSDDDDIVKAVGL